MVKDVENVAFAGKFPLILNLRKKIACRALVVMAV